MAAVKIEVKRELKSARDSIESKDYQTALKHCKAVLKLDKTNYNAFVFVGVASVELGKSEQAQAAYKKAVELKPENILAWQGLASLHEKEPEFGNKEEIIEVYSRLIKHYENSDKKKWADVVLKLADIHKSMKSIEEALNCLKLLQDADCEKDQHFLSFKSIAVLHENKDTLTDIQRIKLITMYRNVLHGSIEPSDEIRQYFQHYIDLLVHEKRENIALPIEEILSGAKRMKELFRKDEFALDILAKLYLEEILEINDQEAAIYDELVTVNAQSSLAHLGLGKVKLFEKDFARAEELLMSGLVLQPTSSLGWYFMSQVQLLRHQYEDAVNSATKGLQSLINDGLLYNQNLVLFNLSLCKAKTCSKLGKDGVTAAIEQLQELSTLQPNNPGVYIELGRIFVRTNDLERAKKYLEKARNVDTVSRCLILEGEIYAAEGEFENTEISFRRCIELEQDVAESYLNLGKLHWKMQEQRRTEDNKCLDYLLKAAKLDPYNSSTFLYLGHYYLNVSQDINKALRCYKKAHNLNQLCDEAGKALGDLYTSLGQEEEAAELYKEFIEKAGIGRVKWPFLRLGLYYLKHELQNDAVKCFQYALRVDVDDANAWECLGEAYMSRGSYTSALASFTQAIELNPSLLYSRYQIAVVKHMLGLFEEAVLVYKTILAEHCDYVPVLKGLGETYISYARSSLHQDFHGRAVDYIQNAIIVLARAIECDGRLSCLWKLLGDVSSLVFKIHDSKLRIELPENLRKFMNVQEGDVVSKMELLNLAASSFVQAVRYNSSCASLWNDVALSYFRMSRIQKDPSERRKLSERSMKALKKGLNMESNNYTIWSTLGIVAASNDVDNPELSQHCFIKSIQSQKNATAWTNLGVLYLRHGKADMANRAFNSAQCTDPSYTQAWIGQATIAEMFADEEAMDLYRHSNELGTHAEGYLGYAHWVCRTLLSHDKTSCITKGKPYADLSHLKPKLRNIVLIASVALNKYTEEIPDDPCALNMHGILLEHQELYTQAETAYSRSLQLLKCPENPDNDYCDVVRANYGRLLCSLGKYSDSIKVYQEINLLNDFYNVTGLALAFLMTGNLQQSLLAYEQAYELATNENQKSHVRAAMGMLAYISNDVHGCEEKLFESSELKPASESGLLALSALGLITSNLSLAAVALAELVKVGQKGDENLIGETSYLFASFYALQGSANIGKSYIVQEIHRRPYSSLLWNNFAKFVVRFQPNKLKQAGKCAEAAHRLGDKNVEDVSTTYAYCTIGCGRDPVCANTYSASSHEICPGVVSAQKAVHMRPDCLTNWALLSAAVTDADHRRFRKSKYQLYERLVHFCLTEAIEVSKRPLSRTEIFEKRNTNITSAIQKWFAIQYGYCLYYSGKTSQAIQHCLQALEIWDTDSTFCARIKLLLVEMKCSVDDIDSSACLHDIAQMLALNQENCYAWQFSALFHEQHGLVEAAEFCYRNCLQLSSKKGLIHGKIISLVRFAHFSLRQALRDPDSTRWIELMVEASNEVLKLVPNSSAAILFLGIAHYFLNHIRQAKDTLCLINKESLSCEDVVNFYVVLLNLKKPDKGETRHDVVQKATRENLANTLQDVLSYFMAMNFDGLERKKMLIKCVHLNPSEIRFWNELRTL